MNALLFYIRAEIQLGRDPRATRAAEARRRARIIYNVIKSLLWKS